MRPMNNPTINTFSNKTNRTMNIAKEIPKIIKLTRGFFDLNIYINNII